MASPEANLTRRWRALLLLVLFALGLACLALPEAAECRVSDGSWVVAEWVRRYNGPGNFEDFARAQVIDGQGNVYVTGSSVGSSLDFLTIKYSPAGQQLWVRRYHSFMNYANAIAVDVQGNVYVTGESVTSTNRFAYRSSFLTIKYDANGEFLWERYYDGPASGDYNADSPKAIAVDPQGNVYVSGTSYGDGTGDDYATVKYDPDGRELWVRRYNGPANGADLVSAMALDSLGNVYVTGYSEGSGTRYDYASIKYSPDGQELWVQRYNGPANAADIASAIGLDPQGNVYVTGYSEYPEGSASSYGYATVKYNAAGRQLWVRRANGSGCNPALALDVQGNVYVAGSIVVFDNDNNVGYDFITLKYSPEGRKLWARSYNRSGNSDTATALAVDAKGNVYVSGLSLGIPGPEPPDYATTIKYSQDGLRLWVRHYNGPGNGFDCPVAIGADAQNNIYVTGFSKGLGTDFDYVTIKYTQTP